jgi:hypothetical protein
LYEYSFLHTGEGYSSWLDTADVLVVGVGAFAQEASELESALSSWLEALESYEARRSKDLAPLRIIWKEYTPAHFPLLVRPAEDAPGEIIWPLPSTLHEKLLNKSIRWDKSIRCTNDGVSLEQARNNFRLTLVQRMLTQHAVSSNGSQPPWELLPLFDVMWERPDMHAVPLSNQNPDCRHWCQFSGVINHWVQTLANGLTHRHALQASPSHETLTHALSRPTELRAHEAPRAALCYVGSVRTGVLPPVHRSVANHLINPWEAAGIAVDTFICASVADSYGHGDGPQTCMPEPAHVNSLLQALRPVHAEFTNENTCAAFERAAHQHNVVIEPEAGSDCCASNFQQRYGAQKDAAHRFQLAAGKQVDFLQLASIKLCFAVADKYAQRHKQPYSHYVRLRPDFAFFRPVPPLPLETAHEKLLVTNPDWNALGSDIFFVVPAELKRSWWDAMSLSCSTVMRHTWPLEYNLFPSPRLPASLVVQNRSIFGGLVRTSGWVFCIRDKHDDHLRNHHSGHVPCSPTSVDGLDQLRLRAEGCVRRPVNESEALLMMYDTAARSLHGQ